LWKFHEVCLTSKLTKSGFLASRLCPLEVQLLSRLFLILVLHRIYHPAAYHIFYILYTAVFWVAKAALWNLFISQVGNQAVLFKESTSQARELGRCTMAFWDAANL